MKLQIILSLMLTSLLVNNTYSQNPFSSNFNANLHVEDALIQKRLDLYLIDGDYISVEKEMNDKGFRFPALVKDNIQNGSKVLEFKAYKITSSNRDQMKSTILQGVPNILNVEITGNNVKATFVESADKYHIMTLFRILGYDSFSKQN